MSTAGVVTDEDRTNKKPAVQFTKGHWDFLNFSFMKKLETAVQQTVHSNVAGLMIPRMESHVLGGAHDHKNFPAA